MLILFHKQTESFSSPLEGFPGSQCAFWKSLSVRLDGSRLALLAGFAHAAHEQWARGWVLPPPTRAMGTLPPAPCAVGMPGILKGHSPAMHMWGFSLSLFFFFWQTLLWPLHRAVLSAGTKLKQRQEGNGGVWGQWGQGLMKQLVSVADVVQIWWGKVFKNKVIGKREKCESKPGSLF